MDTTNHPLIKKILKSKITKKNEEEPKTDMDVHATLSEKEQASVQRILLHLKKMQPGVRIKSYWRTSTTSSGEPVLIQVKCSF